MNNKWNMLMFERSKRMRSEYRKSAGQRLPGVGPIGWMVTSVNMREICSSTLNRWRDLRMKRVWTV